MNATRLLLAPLLAFLRWPARVLARFASAMFVLLGLGAVVSVGFAGPGVLVFLWLAGVGLLASREARRRLA